MRPRSGARQPLWTGAPCPPPRSARIPGPEVTPRPSGDACGPVAPSTVPEVGTTDRQEARTAKWAMAEASGVSGEAAGESSAAVERGLFTCPRCRHRFHRSFLERFWSEWSVLCWAEDGAGYRLDCPLHLPAPENAAGQAAPEAPSSPAAGSRSTPARVLGACLGDCSLCGAHSRVAVLTSGGVVSRCLSCRDEAELQDPPSFCRRARAHRDDRARGVPGPAGGS